MKEEQLSEGHDASSLILHPSSFAFPVRVYYEDTDSGGVVYYANYLKFMERGRTEWLRAHGFEQTELARDYGVIFVVRKVLVEYLRPALFNDLLRVTVKPVDIGRAKIEFEQTVERDETLVTGQVQIACVNAESFRPVSIPAAIKEKLWN
jgi:tol-pal system-associated acyl-CoA thioesterase